MKYPMIDAVLQIFNDFHFLRPYYLWMLIPVFIILILAFWKRNTSTKWINVIAPHLRNHVLTAGNEQAFKRMRIATALTAMLAITGAAGPVWEQVNREPLIKETQVIVLLDASQRMLCNDIKPTRFEWSLFKIHNLLCAIPEIKTELIKFADSAQVVAPLTSDYELIKNRLQNITVSEIVPKKANLESAFKLVSQTHNLRNTSTHVVLFTGGIEQNNHERLRKFVANNNVHLHLVTVATPSGVPIPVGSKNEFLKDGKGNNVLSTLNANILQQIKKLPRTHIHPITLNNSDMQLLSENIWGYAALQNTIDQNKPEWIEYGILLALPLLIVVLLWFRKGFILVAFFFFVSTASAQNLVSDVQVSANSVFVGQPFEVTISLLSTGRFTKSIKPVDLKVQGAYTTYLRSYNTAKTINRKWMPGISMVYHVVPWRKNDLLIPSILLETEIATQGSSESTYRVVRTSPEIIKVKPIPPGIQKSNWLVARNLSSEQTWSVRNNQLKVGDVVERTITRVINGTLPELVPGLKWNTIPGVFLYNGQSEKILENLNPQPVTNQTEKAFYVFTKAGDYTLPDVEILWWNTDKDQWTQRVLEGKTFTVLENPDLEIMLSANDSVWQAKETNETLLGGKQAYTILGYPWHFVVAMLAAMPVLLVILIHVLLRNRQKKRIQRKAYAQSEAYYFELALRAIKRRDKRLTNKAIYRWVDCLDLPEPTLEYLFSQHGPGGQKITDFKFITANILTRARNNYLHYLKQQEAAKEDWIN